MYGWLNLMLGEPLDADCEVVGSPQVTLWVESSDGDADVFVYLEDQEPRTGKARWGPPWPGGYLS